MKPVRLWIAVLLGVLVSFFIALLMSLLVTLRPFLFLPEPFKALISSRVLECTVGAFVAGYLAKRRGAVLGAGVAYLLLVLEHLLYWIWAISNTLPSWAREGRIFTGDDLNIRSFLSATVVFIGLIAGALGESTSRVHLKTSSLPTISNSPT